MCKDVTISEIKEAQRICLERGIPFFAYRLPDSGNFCFGAQILGEVAGNCSPSVFLEDSGFLFSPFHVANNSPVRFLRNDIDLSKAGDLDILKVTPKKNVPDTVPVGEIGKDIYIKQAERVISALRSGKIRKAVLSRVKQSFCDPYKKVPEWFNGLCETYPDAFVFLVSIPGETLWMGATPETFLRCSASCIQTMSLAGTKRKDDFSEWGEKDREEQRIVTEYIESCFRNIVGTEPLISGPELRQAGVVSHLCTMFTLNKSLSPGEISRLINALHPTPAVGGFPLREALKRICEIENRERRYYAGYLGPVYGNGQFDLFVNLRSMELFRDRVELHVGGGLTALSDADSEWNETEIKSRTLLNLIE